MSAEKEYEQYIEAESRLKKRLDELGSDECKCKTPEWCYYIHYGEWHELICRCMKCGGHRE